MVLAYPSSCHHTHACRRRLCSASLQGVDGGETLGAAVGGGMYQFCFYFSLLLCSVPVYEGGSVLKSTTTCVNIIYLYEVYIY